MTKRKLRTIRRIAKIKKQSLNEKCQELVQNEEQLKDLIRASERLRHHQEEVLSARVGEIASLQQQVQSALWGAQLDTRRLQLQKMVTHCQQASVRLRRSVADKHNEIKALEKYIERLKHELLCEAEAAAASYADDLHLSQRQEGIWK